MSEAKLKPLFPEGRDLKLIQRAKGVQGVDFDRSHGPVRQLRSSILRSWEVSKMREEPT